MNGKFTHVLKVPSLSLFLSVFLFLSLFVSLYLSLSLSLLNTPAGRCFSSFLLKQCSIPIHSACYSQCCINPVSNVSILYPHWPSSSSSTNFFKSLSNICFRKNTKRLITQNTLNITTYYKSQRPIDNDSLFKLCCFDKRNT